MSNYATPPQLVVEPAERDQLRALLDGLGSGEPAEYVVRCACDPGTCGSGGATVVDHVGLFLKVWLNPA
jgi:hypothetical protein